MATTYKRICLKDLFHPEAGQLLERGKEYITSKTKDGEVRVFTRYWFWIDEAYFGGEVQFTGRKP